MVKLALRYLMASSGFANCADADKDMSKEVRPVTMTESFFMGGYKLGVNDVSSFSCFKILCSLIAF
jgi:hypothetical protein